MRVSRCRSAGLLAFSIAAAGAAASDAPVSFRTELQPIINARCVVCHVTGAENGGLNLARSAVRANLVSAPSTESKLQRVAPGRPDESYLMHKLLGTQATVGGIGGRMPLTDASSTPLDEAQIRLFRVWIEQGAQDN